MSCSPHENLDMGKAATNIRLLSISSPHPFLATRPRTRALQGPRMTYSLSREILRVFRNIHDETNTPPASASHDLGFRTSSRKTREAKNPGGRITMEYMAQSSALVRKPSW